MKAVAFAAIFLVLLGYGAFGWTHRRFTLGQVAAVAAVTGLCVGVLISIATGTDKGPAIVLTSFFGICFAGVGTLFSYLNRKAVP